MASVAVVIATAAVTLVGVYFMGNISHNCVFNDDVWQSWIRNLYLHTWVACTRLLPSSRHIYKKKPGRWNQPEKDLCANNNKHM